MAGRNAKLLALVLVIQLVCWRGKASLQSLHRSGASDEVNVPTQHHLARRSFEVDASNGGALYELLQSLPSLPADSHHGKKDDKKKKKHDSKKHDKKHDEKKHTSHHSTTSHSHTSTTSHATTTTTTSSSSSSTTSSSTTTAAPHKHTQVRSCHPLPLDVPPENLCAHIIQYCPPSGHVDYLRTYYCAGTEPTTADPPDDDGGAAAPLGPGIATRRGAALAGIIFWMLLLFSTVGIVASDFFCPNLSTLAARLGLNESTAGVTFLAFGNGSPDVFSTFGAMKTGSGSLAIGELIGAASFIVSVISGSMMLIAPFRVKAYPFLRDVGFFTVAVAMTLTFLFDGKLRFIECVGLICLYVCYATTVIVGSLIEERRRKQRVAMAAARGEYASGSITPSMDGRVTPIYTPSHSQPLLHSPVPPTPSEYDPDVDPLDIWASQQGHPGSLGSVTANDTPSPIPPSPSVVRAQSRFRPGAAARHSLLGALEFRDVVRSLQAEAAADRSMEIFLSRDPERFLPHPSHHHHRSQSHSHLHRASHGRHHSTSTPGGPMSAMPAASAPLWTPAGGGRDRSNSFGNGSPGRKPKLHRSRSTGRGLGEEQVVSPRLSSAEWSTSGSTIRLPGAPAPPIAPEYADPWREGDWSSEGTAAPAPAPHDLAVQPEHDNSHSRASLPRLHTGGLSSASSSDRGLAAPRARSPVPSIQVSSPGGADFKVPQPRRSLSSAAVESLGTPAGRRHLHRHIFRPFRRALFPSLRHFHEKSWLGIVVSVVTAPALLVLNLTLPVVDDDAEACAAAGMRREHEGGGVRLEGDERSLIARIDEESEPSPVIDLDGGRTRSSTMSSDPWAERDRAANAERDLSVAAALRDLPAASPASLATGADDDQADEVSSITSSVDSHNAAYDGGAPLLQSVAQCAFAPPFIVWALTDEYEPSSRWKVLLAFFAGLGLASVALLIGLRARAAGGAWQSHRNIMAAGMARCCLGFIVSVMWIMTIVDEVVCILQTIGIIVGLSDAILGLTVFAIGNSLGDLVANVTIAKMGHPIMAISACFAGPLLNLLLGIGISGTWMLSGSHVIDDPHSPIAIPGIYHIDFSPTLLVSGLGLLLILIGTLIAVPMNGFLLTRSLGMCLIASYSVIFVTNVLVEVFTPFAHPHSNTPFS